MLIPESLEQTKRIQAREHTRLTVTQYLRENYVHLLPEEESLSELMKRVDESLDRATFFRLTSTPDVYSFVVMDLITHKHFYTVPELKNRLQDADAPRDRKMLWMITYANPKSFASCFSLQMTSDNHTQVSSLPEFSDDAVYLDDSQ